ncbi:hypothetical protein C8E97_1331 [Saccharothrix australiensis]|uniref:Uncharacterized protein n=1 Tax=Saccharothrix australiensis TaxID=2072 RepID=A0A495VWQ1_9PSEU|nr:hypothetical protein C8E97_1331 [Saccharothrix australiensis]
MKGSAGFTRNDQGEEHVGFLQTVITDSLLSDAGEIDGFAARHAPGLPSIQATLRVIRDIDPESFRQTGGTCGAPGNPTGRISSAKRSTAA